MIMMKWRQIKMEEQLNEEQNQPTVEQEEHNYQQIPKNRCENNHPLDQIIGDKDARIGTRRRLSRINEQVHLSLLSTIEPSTFAEASTDK